MTVLATRTIFFQIFYKQHHQCCWYSASSLFGRRSTTRTTQASDSSENKALATKEPVPDVMVTFGNPPNHMTFLSHPGMNI